MSPRKWIGVILVVVCLGSVALRAGLSSSPGSPATESPSSQTASREDGGTGVGSTLLPGTQANGPSTEPKEDPPPEEAPTALEDALPIVTEASFFGMLGFALGYASKKILKLAMIFVALFFVLLQGLVMLDIATLDWSRAVDLVNQTVMNLKQDQTITEALTRRIPAAATLLGGFLVGFRRG